MADYNKWTKDDLIQRVRELESELKTQHASGARPAAPPASVPASTTPPDGDVGANSAAGQPAQRRQKKSKPMDPSRYETRLIALKLAYLGKNYNGFEYQASGVLTTIEEELWKALVKACLIFPNPARPNEVDWSVCEYSKCGRTDRGVSAFGQVVALRVRSNKPAKREGAQQSPAEGGAEGVAARTESSQGGDDVIMTDVAEAARKDGQRQQQEEEDGDDDDDNTPLPVEQEIPYARMLNRILPPDIRVYAWCPNPPPDFSARFSCRERQYRYFFTQPAFAPLPNFLEGTGGGGRPKGGWLDIDAMRRAAKLFEGLHDFRNFCKIDPSKQITNFVRRIYEADVVEVDGVDSAIPYLAGEQYRDPSVAADHHHRQQRHPKVYYFHVRGSAFLWHQIRCMVAVLFLVGQGLEPASVVAELLDAEKNPRRPNYVLADDAPLVLWDCVFGRGAGDDIANDDLAAAVSAAGAGSCDALDWTVVGADASGPLGLHGSAGVMGDLWSYWRERKMDEILANRLVDWVSQKTDVHRVPGPDAAVAAAAAAKAVQKSTRVFEGGSGPKLAGTYVPVLEKTRVQSPEEQNDRWAQRKGFKSAEEMRARGNWREVIRAAKEAGGAGDQG